MFEENKQVCSKKVELLSIVGGYPVRTSVVTETSRGVPPFLLTDAELYRELSCSCFFSHYFHCNIYKLLREMKVCDKRIDSVVK